MSANHVLSACEAGTLLLHEITIGTTSDQDRSFGNETNLATATTKLSSNVVLTHHLDVGVGICALAYTELALSTASHIASQLPQSGASFADLGVTSAGLVVLGQTAGFVSVGLLLCCTTQVSGSRKINWKLLAVCRDRLHEDDVRGVSMISNTSLSSTSQQSAQLDTNNLSSLYVLTTSFDNFSKIWGLRASGADKNVLCLDLICSLEEHGDKVLSGALIQANIGEPGSAITACNAVTTGADGKAFFWPVASNINFYVNSL